MAAMLSRSGVRVFASAAKDNKPRASAVNRVVPKASLNDAPKQFIETGAEAPMAAGSLSMTTTPFDNYAFAPIREATVSFCCCCYRHWLLLLQLPQSAAAAIVVVSSSGKGVQAQCCVCIAQHVIAALWAGSARLYCAEAVGKCGAMSLQQLKSQVIATKSIASCVTLHMLVFSFSLCNPASH
jgi:hypothetical protein